MSLLAEVLSSAEKVELKDVEANVPRLVAQVQNVKSDVLKYTNSAYVKFTQNVKQNTELLNKAKKAHSEIGDLLKTVESITKKDLSKAKLEIKELENELRGEEFALQVVLPLCKINEDLLLFNKMLRNKSLVKCMELVKSMELQIGSISDEECLDALIELSFLIKSKKQELINVLHNIFNDNIILSKNENNIKIKVRDGDDDVQEALLALYTEETIFPLDRVTSFLWNEVFIWLVDNTTKINKFEDDCYKVLEIEMVNEKADTYKNVFDRITSVFVFLHEHFDLPVSSDLTTLGYIGRDIRDNLSELLINNCLQKTVPSSDEGLAEYKIVIEDTEKLQKCLVECNIFTEDTMGIIEYANNIDTHFINKKCQEYMREAQAIMKKDLHDMVEVGVPYNPNNPFAVANNDFVQCSISKNVKEILSFMESILQKSLTSSEVCAGRLFCTVQNIIVTYGEFVLEHHKKLLQTIPQQIALFYNNCMYISHKLHKWETPYCLKLNPILKMEINFHAQCDQLETLAKQSFENYIETQIKQINEIMTNAGLSAESLTKLEPATEKCVRQSLRQQELLKTVWSKVLSYIVYNKTLGVIFDFLCQIIVKSVVKFEDIPSDVAEQLADIIKIVLTRGPKLFTDPNEISLYVKSWYRLNELNFILSSNLISINDRWADGKGPLALQFKCDELKQLIRALFQNTDRRAAILAKIQE
ncbi:unnamed protein product [Brassicogethes aeneus]|uniref:Centromere/kinetochore protein zw10 homolog n=1 Tax=Brassicogethes aeneus TaxID=1431903 RepID=A0A9P0FJK9_BRAAE|nr:unnamed protein product [Brassicogethes aeneus]